MVARQRKGGAAMSCSGSRSCGGNPPVDAATSSTNEIHGYNGGFIGVSQTSPSVAFFGGSPMYMRHQPLDVATCHRFIESNVSSQKYAKDLTFY
ncbi:hypothetical protein ABZP36_021341 [Zizania latifolia]